MITKRNVFLIIIGALIIAAILLLLTTPGSAREEPNAVLALSPPAITHLGTQRYLNEKGQKVSRWMYTVCGGSAFPIHLVGLGCDCVVIIESEPPVDFSGFDALTGIDGIFYNTDLAPSECMRLEFTTFDYAGIELPYVLLDGGFRGQFGKVMAPVCVPTGVGAEEDPRLMPDAPKQQFLLLQLKGG